MQTHQMKLSTEPFLAIKEGRKVIESRLYDEKRQQIAVGDEIVFTENDNPEHVAKTTVIGLLCYQSFQNLFADHDPAMFGGERTREQLLAQIKQFYPEADEQKYGVVGIRLQLVA